MRNALLRGVAAVSCLIVSPATAATTVTIKGVNIDFFGEAVFTGNRDVNGVLTLAGLTSATGSANSDVGEIPFLLANLSFFDFRSASDFRFNFVDGSNTLSGEATSSFLFLGATIVNRDTGVPTGFSVPPSAINITVDEVANVVPEPATWALMLTGFGMVGYAMRRRRAKMVYV